MLWRIFLFGLVVFANVSAGADPATAARFERVPLGPAVLSLPEDWRALGRDVPLWIHLHGATDVMEREFASIGAPGVLVTLTLPGLSKVYADHFRSGDVFGRLIGEADSALRTATTSDGGERKIGRVTVSSFSAGFGGVRELLKQPAAFDRISALVMLDSIYCGFAGEPAQRAVDAELMAGFTRFAREAAENRKRMVITHSAQPTSDYASTTETADFLIRTLGGVRGEADEEWAPGWRQVSEYSRGQFEVIGFAGASAEDHLRHLRASGAILGRVAPLVARSAKTLAELRTQLGRHVTHERFSAAAWGVKVVSLESGQTLFEHHADRLLSPASNAKLYVGALALDRLGGDHRIATPIFATAKPDESGLLRGDVIVSGRGDPSWNSGSARARFAEVIAPLVEAIQRAGVKRITGDLVADATFFRGGPAGAGWTADDLNDYYGAEISALTLEDNYVDLRIAPGASEGEPAVVSLGQPHTGLTLDNRIVTSPRGTLRRIEVRRLIGERVVHLFGQIPAGAATVTEEATVPRPAQWLAAALKASLEARGIAVDGTARSVRWPESPASGAASVRLAELASPPMRELVSGFMKPSNNLQTDLIFGYLGERTRTPETPAWRSSEALAVRELREFLRSNQLEADDVRFEEGSGLSRNNLTTARATVALLRFMAEHREAEAFRDSLPLAGVDGTLRRRFKGMTAEGNVRAKTGTLRWASSLSGYVTSAAGERLAFSVMLNRAVAAPGRSVREEVETVVEMLARFEGRRPEAQ
jgi:D-alanyl-D-alanine carboxypeptidase/D-alanyl-D-alanine-endopeptidase (penicillin-binding protein 4)